MYLKKVVFILISFFMFINVSAMDVDTYSKNAVLYNLNDDSIVAEEAKDEIVSIASMTKIMTTLVALENIDDINEKVTLTSEVFKGLKEANASVAGFKVGEKVPYNKTYYMELFPLL